MGGIADARFVWHRDIMKLTALFTARRGRAFLNALSMKEGRNYQFDFLKPTHSLFAYFNQLIEQYTRVLLPSQETLAQLKERAEVGAKWKMLDVARKHAKWEQKKREQEKKREDDREAERSAFSVPLVPLIISVTPTVRRGRRVVRICVDGRLTACCTHSRVRRDRLARLCHRADDRVHRRRCRVRASAAHERAGSRKHDAGAKTHGRDGHGDDRRGRRGAPRAPGRRRCRGRRDRHRGGGRHGGGGERRGGCGGRGAKTKGRSGEAEGAGEGAGHPGQLAGGRWPDENQDRLRPEE